MHYKHLDQVELLTRLSEILDKVFLGPELGHDLLRLHELVVGSPFRISHQGLWSLEHINIGCRVYHYTVVI